MKQLKALHQPRFLEPLLSPDGVDADTGAYQMRDMALCFASVRDHESKRGFLFDYIVYARADLYWFTTLPPLQLLQAVDPLAVWIPDGQDSDGLNDRVAIVPRRWAEIYFNRWGLLLNGTLLQRLGACMAFRKEEKGFEWLLYALLRTYRVPVLRFNAVAAIQCIGKGRPKHSSCTRTLKIDYDRVRFKYSQELSEATFTARFLKQNWTWRPGEVPRYLGFGVLFLD